MDSFIEFQQAHENLTSVPKGDWNSCIDVPAWTNKWMHATNKWMHSPSTSSGFGLVLIHFWWFFKEIEVIKPFLPSGRGSDKALWLDNVIAGVRLAAHALGIPSPLAQAEIGHEKSVPLLLLFLLQSENQPESTCKDTSNQYVTVESVVQQGALMSAWNLSTQISPQNNTPPQIFESGRLKQPRCPIPPIFRLQSSGTYFVAFFAKMGKLNNSWVDARSFGWTYT